MGKRRFRLIFFMYSEAIDVAVIELDDAVIDAVDDEWRKAFYCLVTPEAIARHIGYNLIINRQPLSNLDGWANMPDSFARVVEQPDLAQWTIEAEEV